MVSTVQLTYISAVKLVAGEPCFLCVQEYSLSIKSVLSFPAAFREISSTAELMKLLLAIQQHVKTTALSRPLPARRRESSRPLTIPGQSTVELLFSSL